MEKINCLLRVDTPVAMRPVHRPVTSHSFRQNHDNPTDNGEDVPMVMRLMPEKVSTVIDLMKVGEKSQLGKHGFSSLHNFTWTCYHNEDILLGHGLLFTKEIDLTSFIQCFGLLDVAFFLGRYQLSH